MSSDGRKIVNAASDGVSVHWLAPYTSGDDFWVLAESVWNCFRESYKPDQITRIGLRYINRIDLPDGPLELSEYVHLLPSEPTGFPGQTNHYFLRLLVRLDELSQATVIETPSVDAQSGNKSILLDVDVFQTTELPVITDSLEPIFSRFREYKNTIFESCITQKTRELFQS